jgi:AraC-like DNA-binding protein
MPKSHRPAQRLSTETDAYIAQHYWQGQVTAREVAAALGVSLSTLYRAVRRPGFKERLRAVRIAHACELLRESTVTIRQIAKTVGYPNTSALDHDFNRLLHESPRAFRHAAQATQLAERHQRR